MRKSDLYLPQLAWAMFVLGVLFAIRLSFTKIFNCDEMENVHTAWLILQGKRPYLDFFQHHHPLYYYLIQPIVKFFERDPNVMIIHRVAVWPAIALQLSATFYLARRVFDPTVAVMDGLEEYYFWNWTFNRHLTHTFSPFDERAISILYTYSPLAILFAIYGILRVPRLADNLEFLFIGILLFFSLFLMRVPWGHYWLPILPFFVVFACYGLYRITQGQKATVLYLFVAMQLLGVWKLTHLPSNESEMERIANTIKATKPGDKVYGGDLTLFNLFSEDIDYFWRYQHAALPTIRLFRDYPYNLEKLIEEKLPKLISTVGIDLNWPIIKKKYEPTKFSDEIWQRKS